MPSELRKIGDEYFCAACAPNEDGWALKTCFSCGRGMDFFDKMLRKVFRESFCAYITRV